MARKYNKRPDTPEYKAWRNAVLNRDHRTCQLCDRPKRSLQVHHIYMWATYPELRYSVDNGIALCWNCHKKVTKNEASYIILFKNKVTFNKAKTPTQKNEALNNFFFIQKLMYEDKPNGKEDTDSTI